MDALMRRWSSVAEERSAARIRFAWLRAYRFEDGPMPWYKSAFGSAEGRVRYLLFRLRRAAS